MTISRSFRTTLFKRAQSDRKFLKAMLKNGLDEMLSGHLTTGIVIIVDYMKALIEYRIIYKPIPHNHNAFLKKASKRKDFKRYYNRLEKRYALLSERFRAS